MLKPNLPDGSMIDPVVFVYPNGRTQVKESGLDVHFRGVKLDGKRPSLILYPEGLLTANTIDKFKYVLHPYHGQAISYKPTGAPYLVGAIK